MFLSLCQRRKDFSLSGGRFLSFIGQLGMLLGRICTSHSTARGGLHLGTASKYEIGSPIPSAPATATYIDEDDLTPVDRGHDWFRDLHNEFIRVANAHKKQHGW